MDLENQQRIDPRFNAREKSYKIKMVIVILTFLIMFMVLVLCIGTLIAMEFVSVDNSKDNSMVYIIITVHGTGFSIIAYILGHRNGKSRARDLLDTNSEYSGGSPQR